VAADQLDASLTFVDVDEQGLKEDKGSRADVLNIRVAELLCKQYRPCVLLQKKTKKKNLGEGFINKNASTSKTVSGPSDATKVRSICCLSHAKQSSRSASDVTSLMTFSQRLLRHLSI